jgi:hypothetical protein
LIEKRFGFYGSVGDFCPVTNHLLKYSQYIIHRYTAQAKLIDRAWFS